MEQMRTNSPQPFIKLRSDLVSTFLWQEWKRQQPQTYRERLIFPETIKAIHIRSINLHSIFNYPISQSKLKESAIR